MIRELVIFPDGHLLLGFFSHLSCIGLIVSCSQYLAWWGYAVCAIGVLLFNRNIERHTAHTIDLWPNPKQWIKVHNFDLMMEIRQSIYIILIITREMGKLKTNSPTYCIMDNWVNMLNLTHTPDKIYLTGILQVQCLQISLHNGDNEMVCCTNKRVRSASQNVSDYLHSS